MQSFCRRVEDFEPRDGKGKSIPVPFKDFPYICTNMAGRPIIDGNVRAKVKIWFIPHAQKIRREAIEVDGILIITKEYIHSFYVHLAAANAPIKVFNDRLG